jgi:hypothetical protein
MRASWWNPGVMGLLGAVAFVSTNVECTGDDKDKDGIGSFADNCPDVANASQADTDGDRIGDACDKCPTEYAETSPDGCPVAEEHCSDAVDDDGDALVDCDDPDCSEDPLCQGQGGGGSGGGGAGGGGQGGGGAGGGGQGGGGAGGGGRGRWRRGRRRGRGRERLLLGRLVRARRPRDVHLQRLPERALRRGEQRLPLRDLRRRPRLLELQRRRGLLTQQRGLRLRRLPVLLSRCPVAGG